MNTTIDWEEIEKACANTKGLPDCVPQNIRQWEAFIKQYERACDLVNGKWEPHYNWNTEKEFAKAVNGQFCLGKGYKHSIYECFKDFNKTDFENLFKNVDWSIIKTAWRFITWDISLGWENLDRLPLLPKKVGGYFDCSSNKLTSLKGCPVYIGEHFFCDINLLTSLKGCPEYVGGHFICESNQLNSIDIFKNISRYGGTLYTSNNIRLNRITTKLKSKIINFKSKLW